MSRKREDDPDRTLRTRAKKRAQRQTSEKSYTSYYDTVNQNIPMLFICTTLWHEEENEMEQLLNSLVRKGYTRNLESIRRVLIFKDLIGDER